MSSTHVIHSSFTLALAPSGLWIMHSPTVTQFYESLIVYRNWNSLWLESGGFVVGIRQDDKLQIWNRKALLVDYAKHWILGSDQHFRLSKESKKPKEIHICQGKKTLLKFWNRILVNTSLLIVEVSNKLFKIRQALIVFINTGWNPQDVTVVRIIIYQINFHLLKALISSLLIL